jgi:ATP-dependent helicase/nuclease subunit B
VLLLLAELAAESAAPVPLVALLQHPLVNAEGDRNGWLRALRRFELELRGPRKAAGLAPLRALAAKAQVADWWGDAEARLAPLLALGEEADLAIWLDLLATTGEALCGLGLWAKEDGRALSMFVEDLRLHARDVPMPIRADDLPSVLRDAMDLIAVRPPYGGHSRVAIYGLLEARMTRAELVICAGLNEGTWPPRGATDPLLAPGVLRALGVPGADFRIGLAAHDLTGMLGAPEVVLTRSRRDMSGPAIASRFLLRVRALLGGDLVEAHEDKAVIELAHALEPAPLELPLYPRPQPCPSAELRAKPISVTALDRLRSDPYQYYASAILALRELRGLDAEPDAAWQGELAHAILQDWHEGKGSLSDLAARRLQAMSAHPLMRALWRPRLLKALQWVELELARQPGREPIRWEKKGKMEVRGITVHGRADRIDRLPDGTLAVVDYKTGHAPSKKEVAAGYALQLGTIGLILRDGAFDGLSGAANLFEYWKLGKDKDSETGFGSVSSPLRLTSRQQGIEPADFLPETERFLHEALDRWILGSEPFTARLNPDAKSYATFDQLMRLGEWQGREQ